MYGVRCPAPNRSVQRVDIAAGVSCCEGMSLQPQRLASIALIAVALGFLAWSEFSGKPVGPAQASAGSVAMPEDVADEEGSSLPSASDTDDASSRVAFAGVLRTFADASALDVHSIEDPFVEPASWRTLAADLTPAAAVSQPSIATSSIAPAALELTSVLNGPNGAVAIINGQTVRLGQAVDIDGAGAIELLHVDGQGRSVRVATPWGEQQLELSRVIGTGNR